MLTYNHYYGHLYFWRTSQQQEIDFIEDIDGSLSIYEFKYSEKKMPKFPKTFLTSYPIKRSIIINRKNYFKFLLETSEINKNSDQSE